MDDVFRSATAAVNAAFAAAAVDVTIEQWTHDSEGEEQHAVGITRKALVDGRPFPHAGSDGQVPTTRARVSFVEAIPANGAAGRHAEPLDPRDIITLPSGLAGRILQVPIGTLDPSTGLPYASTVWLV